MPHDYFAQLQELLKTCVCNIKCSMRPAVLDTAGFPVFPAVETITVSLATGDMVQVSRSRVNGESEAARVMIRAIRAITEGDGAGVPK